jgi:NADH:ubiquinone oxidoreductase subunit H
VCIVFGLICIFLANCICLLLITVIITILTGVERKVSNLLRRRVGLIVFGYRSRLWLIADASKLLDKGVLGPAEANNLVIVGITSIVLVLYYTFCLNSF